MHALGLILVTIMELYIIILLYMYACSHRPFIHKLQGSYIASYVHIVTPVTITVALIMYLTRNYMISLQLS